MYHPLWFVFRYHFLTKHVLGDQASSCCAFHLTGENSLFHQRTNQISFFAVIRNDRVCAPEPTKVHVKLMAHALHLVRNAKQYVVFRPYTNHIPHSVSFHVSPQFCCGTSFGQFFVLNSIPILILFIDFIYQCGNIFLRWSNQEV